MAISPKQMHALGWRRTDSGNLGKCGAYYQHTAGWTIQHCGHPTANWPYLLYSPEGVLHLTGAAHGQPTYGTAWRHLESPMRYVFTVTQNARTTNNNKEGLF